jgi:hypothetical protein
MSAITIEYDRRERLFALACSCGWLASASELYRVAAPIGEHLKGCDGTAPRTREPYDADAYAEVRRAPTTRRDTKHNDRPGRKLTANEVRTMRERHAAGETQSALADSFDVTQATVSGIVNYRSWQHIE